MDLNDELDLSEVDIPGASAPVASPVELAFDPFDLSGGEAVETTEAAPTGHEWNPDQPPKIVDPVTGEIVDPENVDQLAESFKRVDSLIKSLYATKNEIVKAIVGKAEGDTITRYVRGENARIKVTMPSTTFEQAPLREAWNNFPQFRDQVMKIATLGVKKVEFKKIVKESGPEDFEAFKKLLILAERPGTANPTIKIEE